MTLRLRFARLRNVLLAAGASGVLTGGLLAGAGVSQAAVMLPCDIYAAAGTPCVAA